MDWTVGDNVDVALHGFSHDGRCVGRLENGPVVFVQGGLPGRRVRVRLTSAKKRMLEGVVEETLAAAPGERAAPCSHAGECGGCPWQCLPYAEQLVWKKQLVHDSLQRIGKLDVPENLIRDVLPSPAGEWNYRNKMEFAFGIAPDGGTCLGLRRRASREIVEVTDCRLQTPRAMAVLAALRDLTRQSRLTAWQGEGSGPNSVLRFAVIREERAAASGRCVVELITAPLSTPHALDALNASTVPDANASQQALRELGRKLMVLIPGVTGFVHSIRAASSDVAHGEKTAFTLGDAFLEESLHLNAPAAPQGEAKAVRFRLEHNAFFQVNTLAAELLYQTAARMAVRDGRPKTCWDVYCGVGGLTLALAPHCEQVLGLEAVPSAITLARHNAADFPNCRFECADATRLGEHFRRHGTPDVLTLDPPRAGIAPDAIRAILRAKPARLTLVSCDPATLARDIALLAPAYAVKDIQPLDLFPQTPHVETVVELRLHEAS